MQIFKHPHFNFLKYRWYALALSWALISAGVVTVATIGLPRGIEFQGGTSIVLHFDRMPSIDQVRHALDQYFPGGGGNMVVQAYGQPSEQRIMVRVPQVGRESGTQLRAPADSVETALRKANLGNFREDNVDVVGPSVGADLENKAILATTLALGGILIYIALRFQLSFAVGAITASIHDLLITMAFLAFFRYDLTLNVIAAVLTLTGYSMNDTIVIFDRVRENLRGMRKDNIGEVVNVAVNQTLNRTIITGGTTLLSVVALFLFGGEVLRGFAFTMIVGIITGTYSSVFIAAAIVTFWHKGAARAKAAVAAPAPRAVGPSPTASSATAPRARAKSQRKARAS
jgi:preprotein translocase subunit SecF